MKKTTLVILAALAGAGGSLAIAKDSKDEKKIAEIKKIGEPISCVNIRNIRSTKIVDGRTIDFKMNNRKIYRNTLSNKCPRLKFEESFSYRTSQSRLCNVDIIRVLHNEGFGLREGAACGLGKFQQIDKIKTK